MSAGSGVAVVIPNWNGRRLLVECLDALRRQTIPARPIVVDNGSTDGSPALVRERYPEADLVCFPANRGFAAAANAGADLAEGNYVAFLNNDTEPEPQWLEALVSCLDATPAAASAASCVVRHDDPRVIDGAGDALTRSLKAYRRGQGETARDLYARADEVFSASGTACIWRLDAFRALGGFDESFFAYYEDVDLGFRARLVGHGCRYVPTAVVRHHGSATATSEWKTFRGYHAVTNRWAMIVKDAPAALLRRELAVIALGELASLFAAAFTGTLMMSVKAYANVVLELPRLLRLRRSIQRTRLPARLDDAIDGRRFPPVSLSVRRLRSARRAGGTVRA